MKLKMYAITKKRKTIFRESECSLVPNLNYSRYVYLFICLFI